MNEIDMVESYEFMVKHGIKEDRAAIMASAFVIANAIDNGFHALMNDKALGALDLHAAYIGDAIKEFASEYYTPNPTEITVHNE